MNLKKISTNRFLWLIPTVGFYLLLFIFFPAQPKPEYKKLTTHFQRTVLKKQIELESVITKFSADAGSKSYEKLFSQNLSEFDKLYEDKGAVLLIYENDTLKFWSENHVAVENFLSQVCLDKNIVQLNNGWYQVLRKNAGNRVIIGLLLLKTEYKFHNQYIVDAFQREFQIAPETKISTELDNEFPIYDKNSGFLFTLHYPENYNHAFSFLSMLLFLLANVSLYLLLRQFVIQYSGNWNTEMSYVLFGLMLLFLKYSIPYFSFFDSKFFSPELYAYSSYISSVFDLLLYSVTLLILGTWIYKHVDFSIIEKQSFLIRFIAAALLLILFSTYYFGLLTSIVRDSSVPLDLSNFLGLNFYSYVLLFIYACLLFSLYLLSERILNLIKNYGVPTLVMFVLSVLTYLLNKYHIYDGIPFQPFIFVLLISLIRLIKKHLTFFFLSVGTFTIYVVVGYYYLVSESTFKELQLRKTIAENMAEEHDPIVEFLYPDLENSIRKDTVLSSLLQTSSIDKTVGIKHLYENYFSGYWDKYEIKIWAFDALCNEITRSSNAEENKLDFFETLFNKLKTKNNQPHLLYHTQNTEGNSSLLTKIECGKGATKIILYFEMESRYFSELIGFPSLLLDSKYAINPNLQNYSFAKYNNKQLENHSGKYNYPYYSFGLSIPANNSGYINQNGHSHLIYTKDNSSIILSRPLAGYSRKVIIFSFLFSVFGISLLLLIPIIKNEILQKLPAFTLKTKIQLLLLVLLIVSFTIIAFGTVSFIRNQFNQKNRYVLNEKLNSVAASLKNNLGDENALNPSSMQLYNYILSKHANIFFSDIILFDTKGNVFASSRNKLFTEGLISSKMNADAYLKMVINQQSYFTHREEIGNLRYLSSYIPFFNNNNKLLGYINLPYFSKQSEIENEVSNALVTFMSIYLILFLISALVSVWVSNRITLPLKMLQEKLSRIQLGKTNEMITWKQDDEIGQLITEYNRMLVELSHSAEMLAQSERESAWREMAKQVAHEIKNPLTPIKLSVQQLNRTWNNKDEDKEEKIKKFTTMLVEQIDTLANIANEFSNYAKMPVANNENFVIYETLENTANVFKNLGNLVIEIQTNGLEKTIIHGDKEQYVRVFNNLIKNAIQAMEDQEKQLLTIRFSMKENLLSISFSDNGCGVAEEQKTKLFTPNFTTKTSGMGLGLSMVKNIVESSGGKISFVSEFGKGTTFLLELPIAVRTESAS